MDFSELELNQILLRRIAALNWHNPTDIQKKAIPEILSGNDVIICSETGSGKTAAFLLPIVHLIEQTPTIREPSALIVTPTRELATQISMLALELASPNKIRIVNLCGGMAYLPQTRRLRSGVQMIIATPGRLMDFIAKRRVALDQIKFFVLDEADRMLNRDFISTIHHIETHLPPQKQTILVSATLNAQTHKIINKWLKNAVMINLIKEKIIPDEVKQVFYLVLHESEKLNLLITLLQSEKIHRGIIFVSQQSKAELLSKKLNTLHYKTLPLYGKLKQNRRNFVMKSFQNQHIDFIITTDLIARGLDIHPLSCIINFDCPKTAEKYIHRAGRVGRNHQSGTVFTFTLRRDHSFLKRLSAHLCILINPISSIKNMLEIGHILSDEEKEKFCKTP